MDNVIRDDEARVNITYSGQNGDLADPVSVNASDADIRAWITEAVQGGNVPGITVNGQVDFTDFVIDRFAPTEVRPFNLIAARPKTPFGG